MTTATKTRPTSCSTWAANLSGSNTATPADLVARAFASVRDVAELNDLLDAAERLAAQTAQRLGVVSKGGVYVQAPPAKADAPKAKPPKVSQGGAMVVSPKATPAPKADGDAERAKLVAAVKAAKLPGHGTADRWKTDTLKAKLDAHKAAAPKATPAPAPTIAPKAPQAKPAPITLADASVEQLTAALAKRLGVKVADLNAAIALAAK